MDVNATFPGAFHHLSSAIMVSFSAYPLSAVLQYIIHIHRPFSQGPFTSHIHIFEFATVLVQYSYFYKLGETGCYTKFVWVWSQQKAFNDLKQCLCSAPILSLPDLQHPFKIETDASNYVVGPVLTQHGHPVAYHSETLLDIVRKYPTYEKEMYSIV